jgi:WASH complex subunit 7
MASLAAHKYGIALTDNHLPMGCLDAGLDVLQIMRNIHVFVARYNLNLNQQFFVEKRSVKGAKHLNIVTIQSISSSIRQHGTGMMNTTVNFAYQFLAQKFHVFAQFLYDDYIKSYLAKERRFYRRERKALDNRYPYDHAQALCRDIRALGVTADKQSFLDKFRALVSEIGNTLGYVRMVRTAGMRAAAEAVKFVPTLEGIVSLEEAAKSVGGGGAGGAAGAGAAAGLSHETLEASRQLDSVVKNLTASFAEGSDYFKLLVGVFQHVLLGSKGGGGGGGGSSSSGAANPTNASAAASEGAARKDGKADNDLRNFFLIIPALTLSFVDNLRAAKDRMDKSVKGTESFFCDDGFALGLAYVLAILRQDRHFDSLHWWDAILRYHRAELAAYKAEAAGLAAAKSKSDADRADELAFKTRRVVAAQAEFDQLYFAFQGARAFFKTDGSTEDDEVLIAV